MEMVKGYDADDVDADNDRRLLVVQACKVLAPSIVETIQKISKFIKDIQAVCVKIIKKFSISNL